MGLEVKTDADNTLLRKFIELKKLFYTGQIEVL